MSGFLEKAKQKKAKVIVDADGELLKSAVKAGPYSIKPNIHELEMLFDQKIEYIETAIELGRKLLDHGIKIVVISRGEKGSIVITKEKTLMVDAIRVEAKSTVGAGDSMVGVLALFVGIYYYNNPPDNSSVFPNSSFKFTETTHESLKNCVNQIDSALPDNLENMSSFPQYNSKMDYKQSFYKLCKGKKDLDLEFEAPNTM